MRFIALEGGLINQLIMNFYWIMFEMWLALQSVTIEILHGDLYRANLELLLPDFLAI